MPSWADPVVAVGIIVLIGLVAPVIVLLIGKAFAGSEHPMKRKRFESGNPPLGAGRGFFSMEYYPYLLMFILVEPYSVFLFLVGMAFASEPYISGILMLGGAVALVVVLSWARRVAREGERFGAGRRKCLLRELG
ncbi:MAG: NADH-quinone oxidoreductase subunit A [Candidatus Marsarchaeota archaeon]|jgi:NADH-quinone oxidoreductase subunit A